MAQPHAAHPAGRDIEALEAQLVGYALGPVGGSLQGVGEDLLLDLGGDAAGVGVARPAPALHQGGYTASLEGPAHLVEGVAMLAHDLAGSGNVPELLGQLQQRELFSSTLRQCAHLWIS